MKSWFVVRFEDGEPQTAIGPMKKKKAKRLARYYDAGVDVDRHHAVKMEEPDEAALKLARKAEKEKTASETFERAM